MPAGDAPRAQPSQFNTIHIALKQIILKHIYASSRGKKGDQLRDIAVASIDERRLMVSWFYIESREAALRASEEKYRNLINHAPDPMYEIDADTLVVLGANSAAEKLHRKLPGEEHLPLIGRPITDFVPEEAPRRHHRAFPRCGPKRRGSDARPAARSVLLR